MRGQVFGTVFLISGVAVSVEATCPRAARQEGSGEPAVCSRCSQIVDDVSSGVT